MRASSRLHLPVYLVRLIASALLLPPMLSLATALGQAKPALPKPEPDVIVFTNGDQLSGTLVRGSGNSVVFKSDMAGEITVSLDKIKELRSTGSYAVLRKDIKPTRSSVIPGTLLYSDGTLTVATPITPEIVPESQIGYIIDQPTYDMELEKRPGAWYGWHGSINGGTTIVRSTSNGQTYTAGIAVNRAIPAVPYLPGRNRTTFNLQETYGKLTTPVTPQTVPPTPPSIAKTNIFHTDAERDEYFSPRFYSLAQTSFDHNYSQGLNLQQVYGAGVGWTAIKTAVHQLDAKVTMQYEKQQFETPTGKDLVGSTISETYHRSLPRKLVLTQNLNLLPAWNEFRDYSANASIALVVPVFKRLSMTVTTSDNFLNDPAIGFKKNSFQFVTAASYTLR